MTAIAGDPAPLLAVDALELRLGGVAILRGVSLAVRAGEIVGLIGASGSGKSMTALAIMNLLPDSALRAGAVRLRGVELTTKSAAHMQRVRGRDLGMVFQEPRSALNPLMRIGDQVAETARLHGESRAEARRLAREALDSVGLSGEPGRASRLPYELSGGQRQRVAIAMATVMRPALLIADEPTTALDVISQAQVLTLLQDLARSRGMGLLFITHDLAVIAQITDRVAVMQEGRIVEQGPTRELLRHAGHPYTRALVLAATLSARVGAVRPPADPPVLDVRNIVRKFSRPRRSLWRAEPPLLAVDGVSLTVHAGETVGLVGESGSGKSSLLRAILALDRPQSGEVRLLGENLLDATGVTLRRMRRSIQVVFQDPYASFDPLWTVERLISEPFFLMDVPPDAAERRRRVAAVLEQVGLSAADAQRLPHEFSGGQRQRIAVARALITEPAVIAFDEAVSALDVLVRAQILELLALLSARLQLACLFVSHDLHVVRSIADRVYVMQHGKIVEEGTTQALFSAPREAYTRALIAATPRLETLG